MRMIPRFRLMRRVLFPYSGEDALTFGQGLRVILAWMLFLPLIISLLALAFVFLEGASVARMLQVLAFALISGACIFGILGCLIVLVNNRSARIRQAWKIRRTQEAQEG